MNIEEWIDEQNHPLKYYFMEKVKIFEDESHEFKMMSIKDEESIDTLLRMISKYICAFLNSNSGCLYIGISDDGIVKGISVNSSMLLLIKNELNVLVHLFHHKAVQDNLINFKFFNVYDRKENLKMENLYVLEIFTRQGDLNEIYTTPYKDPTTKDYECYIKMNGTTHKIMGQQLQKYVKNKLKKYYTELATGSSETKKKKEENDFDIFC